jgi:hypothetical protein
MQFFLQIEGDGYPIPAEINDGNKKPIRNEMRIGFTVLSCPPKRWGILLFASA